MKPTRLFLAVAIAFWASLAAAQELTDNVLEYQPVACMVADQLTVFQLNVRERGDLRAYYRFVNTPDWCWVQGSNIGPLSTVVMPKFRPDQEIEYFFVLLDGKRLIGKSPVVYRAKATAHCETLVARHALDFVVDCSHEVSGSASSFLAGNKLKTTGGRPPHISPDQPIQ